MERGVEEEGVKENNIALFSLATGRSKKVKIDVAYQDNDWRPNLSWLPLISNRKIYGTYDSLPNYKMEPHCRHRQPFFFPIFHRTKYSSMSAHKTIDLVKYTD